MSFRRNLQPGTGPQMGRLGRLLFPQPCGVRGWLCMRGPCCYPVPARTIRTSWSSKALSAVTRTKPSICACATNMRSNGSRW